MVMLFFHLKKTLVGMMAGLPSFSARAGRYYALQYDALVPIVPRVSRECRAESHRDVRSSSRSPVQA